ncbi:hypothetical protein P5F04_16250, partial [Clostridium perfringens]|nr:hypothetical protein [Clostridium perfringens]
GRASNVDDTIEFSVFAANGLPRAASPANEADNGRTLRVHLAGNLTDLDRDEGGQHILLEGMRILRAVAALHGLSVAATVGAKRERSGDRKGSEGGDDGSLEEHL